MPETIRRPLYLDKITPFIDKPIIKILVGLRRSGKSTILEQIAGVLIKKGIPEENIFHVNFEDLSMFNVRTGNDLIEYLNPILKRPKLSGRQKYYLLFDEIQNVEEWDRVVNGLLSDGRFDIYLTGSNSKMLIPELSTFLTGRFIEIPVRTLNFEEYLSFRKNDSNDNLNVNDEFRRYLDYGGFPAVHANNLSLTQSDELISDIYNSIIFKDLVERKNIRNTELLARVVKFVIDNIGNVVSANSISDFLKNEKRTIAPETIYNYLDWLQEVFAVEKIKRNDLRGKTLLKTNEKYYLGDFGFLYALNGRDDSYSSGVFENAIYHELKTHGFDVTIGKNGDKEIDFVADKKNSRIYVQASKEINSQTTREREFSAFEGLADNYPKFVVTLDSEHGSDVNGIRQISATDFILNELSRY